MTAGGREPGRVQSVCKALDLLECLAGAGTPLTLGELSRRAGMPKATVHGLLRPPGGSGGGAVRGGRPVPAGHPPL